MPELQTLDTSNVNVFALIVLAIVSLVVLFAQPRNAVVGLLFTALFIPLGQQFVIEGLHFRFFRVLILVALLRVAFQRRGQRFRWTGIDGLIIALALVRLVCGLLRGARPEMFGVAYDLLGTYFIFRLLIGDTRDVVWQLWGLAAASVVMATCMSFELFTSQNLFFVFGGVPEFTYVRDGRFRCQGPFRHPILAGTFAATLFPLLVGVWQSERRKRIVVVFGMASCVVATYIAASSGAVLSLMTAMVGLTMWRVRKRMVLIRWLVLLGSVELALLMHAPIWYLIARVSSVAGGTGYHRSYLIDQAVEHIEEWWLIGSSYTAHWAQNPYTILQNDPDNMDITNHYIHQGLQGGLLGLSIFIGIVICCFSRVGRTLRLRNLDGISSRLIWAIGVGFTAHCAAFISVSYFDQILVFWIWLVAVIAGLPVKSARNEMQRKKGSPGLHEAEVVMPASPL
ncbi:hypothetical protein ACXR0O_21755 [Verrucomicrobiota bacterium sgz303538]